MWPVMPVETAQTATTDSITGQLKRKADHVFVNQNGHKDRYTTPQMLKAGSRAGSSADNAIPLDSSDDETDRRGIAGSAPLVKAVRLSASITSTGRFNAVAVRGVPTSNQRPPEEGLALKPADTSRPGDTTTASTTAEGDASCPSTCHSNGSRDTAPLTPAPAPTPTLAAVTPPKCLQTPESEHQHRVSAGTEATPVQKGDTPAQQGGTAPSTPAATPPPIQAPSTGSARPQSSTTGNSPGTPAQASPPNARKPCSPTGLTGPAGCVTATSSAKADNAPSSGAKADAIVHERQKPYPSKTKRRPGRPAGSKNRTVVKDPPYIAASSQQEVGHGRDEFMTFIELRLSWKAFMLRHGSGAGATSVIGHLGMKSSHDTKRGIRTVVISHAYMITRRHVDVLVPSAIEGASLTDVKLEIMNHTSPYGPAATHFLEGLPAAVPKTACAFSVYTLRTSMDF